jgi:hypothetical protein
MTWRIRLSAAVSALAVPVLASLAAADCAVAQSQPVGLASHRAIYDLKLGESRGRRPMAAVRGRIVYDFSGNACEGYALQFRQVTELDNGEGKVAVSDLRSTTWEEAAAKIYRFNFQNYLNDNLIDSVDGRAERGSNAINVHLKKPGDKDIDLAVAVAFPTEQMRRIIELARAGQSILELTVYDGSENGEKLYSTLTVIGRAIAPDERKPADAAADQPALSGLTRWPVTISYFDKSKADGEQTPLYSITFELYENGISRALSLDYGDFVVKGEMMTLEVKDMKPCQ